MKSMPEQFILVLIKPNVSFFFYMPCLALCLTIRDKSIVLSYTTSTADIFTLFVFHLFLLFRLVILKTISCAFFSIFVKRLFFPSNVSERKKKRSKNLIFGNFQNFVSLQSPTGFRIHMRTWSD